MQYLLSYRTIIFLLLTILVVSCGSGDPVTPSDSSQNASVAPGQSSAESSDQLESARIDDPLPCTIESTDKYAPDEVLVSLRSELLPDDSGIERAEAHRNAATLQRNHGLELLDIIDDDISQIYHLKIIDNSTVPDKVAELLNLSIVVHAEPNFIYTFCDVPLDTNDPWWEWDNDSDEDPRTYVREMWGPALIGANIVWNDTIGVPSTVVCILDSGVTYDHEDLENVMWVNEGEIPDNEIDDDENGYVDDYYGWDFDEDDNDIKEYSNEYYYHGTACAGIVAAEQNNELGCTGIAPGSRIMGLKIGFGYGYLSSVLNGVMYARHNGADIISMSFASNEYSSFLNSSMNSAWNDGLLLVSAASNEDSQLLYYPGSYDSVICTGASVPWGKRWNYQPIDEVRISKAGGYSWGSNYGPQLDVMGFGEFYITTHGQTTTKYWDGNYGYFFCGTSCATPVVAGGAALLIAMYPEADNAWIRERIRATADDLDIAGYDIQTGWGRINVHRAVYGSDPYVDEEDANGFVDIYAHENSVFDSIHAVSGDYNDTKDLYKFTATENGHLNFFLDIYTRGETVDLWLYTDSSLDPEYLIDQSTGENHADNSFEFVGTDCSVGETFYLKITPGDFGDSTTYRLTAEYVEPSLELELETYDIGFIHIGGNNKAIGHMDLTASLATRVTEIILNLKGLMPSDKLTGMSLYKDTYSNGVFDGLDTFIADASIHVNRIIFENLYEELSAATGTERYFLFADFSGISEDASIKFEFTSYKDVTTNEGIEIAYDSFPYTFGPYEVGVDIDPPDWDSTPGVQGVSGRYCAVGIQWNSASDIRTPPAEFNVYWTTELPFDFDTADHVNDVGFSDGIGFDHKFELTGLENGQEYHVAVRTEDGAGNEDANTVYLSVTPDDVCDPTWPQVVGSYNTGTDARDVKSDIANHRLFVADNDGGLVILDTSNPLEPVLIDIVAGNDFRGVDYDGTYVYAAYGGGLMIIDPDVPETLSTVEFSTALDCHVIGNWVYVTNNTTALLTVDVTDPYNPTAYPVVNTGDNGYGLYVDNGYLYLATNESPRILNIIDPSAPVQVNEGFGSTQSRDILPLVNSLYVPIWNGRKVEIFDLTNPAAPVKLGEWVSDSGYYGSAVVWFHDYLYFATQSWGIEALDVSDGANPFEIGQLKTRGPDAMDTDGVFIYTAENFDGIKIIL